MRLPFLAALLLLVPLASAQNLLRNGSFEGGTRYWYETDDQSLVGFVTADGENALRLDKGGIQSAAFLLEQNRPVTLSFSARTLGGPGATMGWQFTPCSREIGAKAGLTWGMRGAHPVKLGDEWKRFSFTFTPTVPTDGLWPRPTYMLQIGDADHPILLDAITVAYDAGADGYVPYRPIEVQAVCPELKGYTDPSGNLLAKGQTVTLVAAVSNPTDDDRPVTVRWEMVDYEGKKVLGTPVEQKVNTLHHRVLSIPKTIKLPATGMVLGRVSAIDENGKVIDQSDIPLCSLPYPADAGKPDFRERFGGSIFPGADHNAALLQNVGFRWTRWAPHMGWPEHQPDGPTSWKWFDKELDELAARGFATHFVMFHDGPGWAFGGGVKQLPKDMQWPADDPRWDDLTPQSDWDRFVVKSVDHYRGRPLVYEIENEPEFNWKPEQFDLYAAFTKRTARLIKQTDPKAFVMVDNVYGIPSALNRRLLEKGAGGWIDAISWHDYHEGWLADASAMKRMRQNLDDLGCQKVQIWFNEGWAFTNTIVDEPAVALTHLTSAQSTNAMVDSIAELTANGQDKTVLFHTGYDDHGMSFWDFAGPGTMLWDFYGYPLPLVPAWNVLIHHVGLSEVAGVVRPPGATFNIFQDLRNGRGVMVAYADRGATEDVAVELPMANLTVEDAMGNAGPLGSRTLTLSKTGRPVFLYSADKTDGKTFAAAMAPLDRKNASFANAGGKRWTLPPTWAGAKEGSADGNPATADGKPVWTLLQVFPADPMKPANYRPLVWQNNYWQVTSDGAGGQPKVERIDVGLRLEFRAPTNESKGEKLAALAFTAPADGAYALSGSAELKLWDGGNPVRLSILRRTADAVTEIASIPLKPDGSADLDGTAADLKAGDQLLLLPRIEGMFAGGDVTLRGLAITSGESANAAYRLPAAWEGGKRGTADGNPIAAGGTPVWRLYEVWPDDPTISKNYAPLVWDGTAWKSKDHDFGGQPSATVDGGTLKAAVRGSWTGHEGQRLAGVAFIAPSPGLYRLTATASAMPWEGGAATYPLGLFKRDTQRATREKSFDLPRDGTAVLIEATVELAAGHELILLPLMPDWNNAGTVTISDLTIRAAGEPAGR